MLRRRMASEARVTSLVETQGRAVIGTWGAEFHRDKMTGTQEN